MQFQVHYTFSSLEQQLHYQVHQQLEIGSKLSTEATQLQVLLIAMEATLLVTLQI
jgi:hypothetical protein